MTFVFKGNAKCVLENTLIQTFAKGITCAADSKLSLTKTLIFNCGVALEAEDASAIEITASNMFNNKSYGIYFKTKIQNLLTNEEKRKIVPDLVEMQKLIP